MSFFNKKEDVIDVQLTQYGKYLLSKGKFKPAYYAFFDDDVVYDSTHYGMSEEQNDIQTRIEDTPRTKTQYTFSSREMEVRKLVSKIRSNTIGPFEDTYQPSVEKNYSLTEALGTSMINSKNHPAWSISFYKGSVIDEGTIEESSSQTTDNKQKLNIPQISSSIKYKTQVLSGPEPDEALSDSPAGALAGDQYGAGSQSDLTIATKQYSDGSYISTIEDYILIDALERNVDFENDNFDIEVFRVEENTDAEGKTEETLHPLKFIKHPETIKNGILLDEPEGSSAAPFIELDPTYVEYWLDIFCDHEILEDIICKNRPAEGTQGNIYTKEHYKCPEKHSRLLDRTGLSEEDLGDFCDD